MAEKVKRKNDDRSPQDDSEQAKAKKRFGDDSDFDVCTRLTTAMDGYKLKVSTILTAMEMDEEPSCKDLRMWIMNLAKAQIGGLDGLANIVSDVVEEFHNLEGRLSEKEGEVSKLQEEIREQSNVVSGVVKTKEMIEVKASSRDMEDRLKVATTQFKVMDVKIGKETEDRKEIIKIGMNELKKKVRSDLQEEWEKLVVDVDVAPLARKASRKTGESEYTIPLLFTVQEKNRRWRMEEILRNSRVYPGFHWPQEMLNVVKDYKTVLKDNGVNEDTTYIRIRPYERDGRVKIRADLKAKEGNGRFSAKASWEAPPLCPEVRKKAKEHLKPIWASNARA
jgi:hypothetical protein